MPDGGGSLGLQAPARSLAPSVYARRATARPADESRLTLAKKIVELDSGCLAEVSSRRWSHSQLFFPWEQNLVVQRNTDPATSR